MKSKLDNPKCQGFKFSGISCGLKKESQKDLGLIYSKVPANAAGVFTRNKVIAAPVILCKDRIKKGKCQAIIANSGNANCCTGKQGSDDAVEMAKIAAASLNIDENLVFVASTGVIGKQLNIDLIKQSSSSLIDNLSEDSILDFTYSIMTTDTKAKIEYKKVDYNGKSFQICAVAKGAGMIRPDMATMLCFICTDIESSSDELQTALRASVNRSFNIITIDGDTSTNDTVLLLANGLSGLNISTPELKSIFQNTLDELLINLAKAIVKDGEGVTKLVGINVRGAKTQNDAKKIAETISHSNLVKTALFGEDANWGRIIAAAGRANVDINPDTIDIYFDSVLMAKNGVGCGYKAEEEVTNILKKSEYDITINLNMGNSSYLIYTCDFSLDYVRINADYRT